MPKLFFNYAAMNAGKSTVLLQAAHNYRERGMHVLLLVSAIDDRVETGLIASRIGLQREAEIFHGDADLFDLVSHHAAHERPACVFIDEAQWMTREQIWQLARVVDELNIPVMCYGLRTDFRGDLFPGSAVLLGIADELREIRTICWCGSKAIMVVRLGADGLPVEEGEQIVVGGNERYVSLCRRHWSARDLGAAARSD